LWYTFIREHLPTRRKIMNGSETIANLRDLGEDEYQALKTTYCRLQDLRAAINALHDQYVASGTPPDFDRIEAIHLQMGEVYEELERFLLPLCAESACDPSICQQVG
jgi:hypothetical protein